MRLDYVKRDVYDYTSSETSLLISLQLFSSFSFAKKNDTEYIQMDLPQQPPPYINCLHLIC